MELAKVEIRLRGSLANTVVKRNVTPAELTVLRAVHGDDCVAHIQWTGKKNVRHDEELERLRMVYKTENVRPLIEKLYPGASPKLPVTFKEAGYDVSEEGEIAAKGQLQKKYQNELEKKIMEAAIEAGKPAPAMVPFATPAA